MEQNVFFHRARGYHDLVMLFAGEEKCAPSHSYGPHIREYYILHFCRRGKGVLENKDGRLLVTPPSLMVDGHEYHFAIVRDEFLNMLATGQEPGGLRTQLVAKYKLMAAARDMALQK